MALGYPTPTGFRKLTSCQQDPQNKVVKSSSRFKIKKAISSYPYFKAISLSPFKIKAICLSPCSKAI